MTDEWFRSSGWTLEEQAEFERRLGRGRRASRGQYLRIKGLALSDAGNRDGARFIWGRVLDDPGYEIQRWSTLEHLADLAFDEDPQQSESLYRQLLAEDPSLNATSQMAEVRLAELLIRRSTPEALREAGTLLQSWQDNRCSPFPALRFQWELAQVRWGEAAGRADVVREAARQALALVEAAAPFSRHPGVGLVQADASLIKWLRTRAEA